MPVSIHLPQNRVESPARRPTAALAVASVVGAAVATLAMLFTMRAASSERPPSEHGCTSDSHRYAFAEDAIQRTLECRSF